MTELTEDPGRNDFEEVLAAMTAEVGSGPLARVSEAGRKSWDDNVPNLLTMPELTCKPWWDAQELVDAQILERSAAIIRRELDGVLERGVGFQPYEGGEGDFKVQDTKFGWNVFYLLWSGREVSENCQFCPQTMGVLRSLPNLGCSAYFSALTPGAKLEAHRAYFNNAVTLHLGIDIPTGCTLRVDSETRTWEDGKCLAFQEYFEHEASNPTQRTRFVFLLETWHPEVTPVERCFLQRLSWVSGTRKLQRGQSTHVTRHRQALDGVKWWK
jgi:aspartyl/asparaginyl beta-hydroxylase (cupin superfamily)